MKIMHVPYCFAPDPIGGTEIYVATLAHDLQSLGLDVLVAAPSTTTQSYTIDDLKICRFATHDGVADVSELYGIGDELAATEFAGILDREKPDLIHLHAFTAAVSQRLAQAAKARGIKVVFTYHTPTVSCQRGTLLLWGNSFCDGEVKVHRCAQCTLNGLGLDRHTAAIVGSLPTVVGRCLRQGGLQGGAWTALRMSELIEMRCAAFRQMMSDVDHIVAVCGWVRELLLRNAIPDLKITVSRHGISWAGDALMSPEAAPERETADIRIAFLGRLDRTKGLGVLINALRKVPTLNVSLDVYGVVQGPASAAYMAEVSGQAAGDPRIKFCGSLPPRSVVPRLRDYDFLAVPSQWIETGPLVVLEAFAAGIPVIGWNIGGISEIVRNGVDGLLIDPGAAPVDQWAEVLQLVAEDADLCARLKAGVRPPRNSKTVAREMLELYNSILSRAPASAAYSIH